MGHIVKPGKEETGRDTNFDLAPPPKSVDGLTAVPIDIDHIDAALRFDGATSAGTGDATIHFTMAPTAGNAVFDLRQTITEAWLDGVPLDPASVSHHDLGGGANAQMRILDEPLAASSAHTLRFRYALGVPIGASAGPTWTAGPRLEFRFRFSDLNPARYLEQWIPANLIFDQFALTLDLSLENTSVTHVLITNGTATLLGAGHWNVVFPPRFTALSHMLELRAADSVETLVGSVHLPVSGADVAIELWKPVSDPASLATELSNLQGWLALNESRFGAYLHGNRYVGVILEGGGMEYDGGTTSAPGDPVLSHEALHSWFGRGVKPASQSDGWWDEGYSWYHYPGGPATASFDLAAAPVQLASRNPWQRHTAGNSYGGGAAVFRGAAAMLGVDAVRGAMAAFYARHGDRPATTMDLEGLLVSRSGRVDLVEPFYRFVYGFDTPPVTSDLWLRDEVGDPGNPSWDGPFWASPDVWVRNERDGGTTHQQPIAGRDNYFYARVRNRARSGSARHFLVTFNAKHFAGMEFVYPGDFLPCIAAAAGFDLEAGGQAVVSAKWPAAAVPPARTSTCLLVSAHSWADHPSQARHVWEDNGLAQRNVTVEPGMAGEFVRFPVVIGAGTDRGVDRSVVELRTRTKGLEAALLLPRRRKPPRVEIPQDGCFPQSSVPARVHEDDEGYDALPVGNGQGVTLDLSAWSPRAAVLRVRVPPHAKPGERIVVDLYKRRLLGNDEPGPVSGGIRAEIEVVQRGEKKGDGHGF